jgi:hypothetical protein
MPRTSSDATPQQDEIRQQQQQQRDEMRQLAAFADRNTGGLAAFADRNTGGPSNEPLAKIMDNTDNEEDGEETVTESSGDDL